MIPTDVIDFEELLAFGIKQLEINFQFIISTTKLSFLCSREHP